MTTPNREPEIFAHIKCNVCGIPWNYHPPDSPCERYREPSRRPPEPLPTEVERLRAHILALEERLAAELAEVERLRDDLRALLDDGGLGASRGEIDGPGTDDTGTRRTSP